MSASQSQPSPSPADPAVQALGTSAMDASPVLVEVVRGELVEGIHRARVAVTAPGGELQVALGDVETPMYPRSSNKPFQALAMLSHGLDLEGRLLSLAAASHSGEQIHRDGAVEILASVGLGVEALQSTPEYPKRDVDRDAWVREGHGAEHVTSNCSGKHAAMLRTCVKNGWPTQNYLELDHPLQQAIAETITRYAGEAVLPTVDGCGAPLFGVSLHGLASGFGTLAEATEGPEKTMADAYREFPEYMSGTDREDLLLHRALPGLIVKSGAEAVTAIGLPSGHGIAVKVDDGNARALRPIVIWLLQRLGHDNDALRALATEPVLGHGEPVGSVRVRERALADLVGTSL